MWQTRRVDLNTVPYETEDFVSSNRKFYGSQGEIRVRVKTRMNVSISGMLRVTVK